MIRSLLEGVSYSQKDCLDIIEQMGVDVESIRVSGGGARSAFWRQMLADVFDKRVVTLETARGISLWRGSPGAGRNRRLFFSAGGL